ncbi:MAG: type II secretion system F family protein [Chthoniobacter sp.]|uniref:type II secretion system F family protein n=1 Tax=Chthoniobacter sp. TaxID=2510640 RepID=UPI0032A3A3ED
MSLTLREKQRLYHSLAQLVRPGIPFPSALDKLAPSARGDARRLIEAARKSLHSGHTVGEAFAAQPSIVTPLEIAVISAVEKSGHLERGLSELSEYFGSLHQARVKIRDRCAYPIFLLHFGILVLNVPTMVLKDAHQYWHDVGTAFFFFYGAILIVALATPLLRDGAEGIAALDRLLISIPLLGNIRRAFALSRFCTVYGMQLDAGINVIDSVQSAGRSSLSGLVRSAVDSALPRIRAGSQVGPLLAASDAFPTDLTQALIVGEETGSLDDELRRMAREFRDRALSALERFADWLPKVIYVAIVMYLGWKMLGLIQTTIVPYYRAGLGE